MTPDLSTPEGRAEIRAEAERMAQPLPGSLRGLLATHARGVLRLLRALDASAERENALSREIIALRSDLDAAHATIERLTAPVTEEEGRTCANVYLDINILTPMREVLDAFIARRKDTAP